MRNEGFNQLAAGSAEGLRAAKICGVRFHQIRIEIVLADQKAELIAQPGLAVA